MQSDFLLIAAPTKAGEDFMKQVKLVGLPFIALTNNKIEKLKLKGLGVKQIIQMDTSESGTSIIPDYPIGNVILFEESLPLCCRYIQKYRSWTSKPMQHLLVFGLILREVSGMLDVIMVAGFILLTAMMVGVSAWAGKVVEEGSGNK